MGAGKTLHALNEKTQMHLAELSSGNECAILRVACQAGVGRRAGMFRQESSTPFVCQDLQSGYDTESHVLQTKGMAQGEKCHTYRDPACPGKRSSLGKILSMFCSLVFFAFLPF